MAEETSWLDTLPDDLKADPNVVKFKSPAEMAKSYIEASRMIGASIRPPGADASDDAKKEFREKMQKAVPDLIYAPEGSDEAPLFKRLGRPEKEDGYTVDEETAKAIDLASARKQAAEAGLTVKQFQILSKQTAAQVAVAQEAARASQAALRTEWGAAYDERVQQVAAAATKLGMSETQVAAILKGSIPVDQMKFLHTVALAVGANPKEMRQENASGALAPADALMAISEIMHNRAHPYWNDRDPAHGAAIQKMLKLQELAGPRLTSRTG
jgi:hypothetical protein